MLREPFVPGFTIPLLERLGGNLSFDKQLRELAPLRLALERLATMPSSPARDTAAITWSAVPASGSERGIPEPFTIRGNRARRYVSGSCSNASPSTWSRSKA